MYLVFFFNDTATTEIYTLSLHDALPISAVPLQVRRLGCLAAALPRHFAARARSSAIRRVAHSRDRSEEHTSELQSRSDLVCRLLLEKNNRPLYLQCPT